MRSFPRWPVVAPLVILGRPRLGPELGEEVLGDDDNAAHGAKGHDQGSTSVPSAPPELCQEAHYASGDADRDGYRGDGRHDGIAVASEGVIEEGGRDVL